MKQKYLWIGLAGVALSWMLNLIYFQSTQLEEPIFMDHYYEGDLSGEGSFTFYYLDNKTDPKEIAWISLGDGPELWPKQVEQDHFFMDEEEPSISYVAEYSHYYLRSVVVEWRDASEVLDDEAAQEASFEKIHVGFNDGTEMEADVGEVRFYRGNDEEEERLWDQTFGSSSSDGETMNALTALEDIQVNSLSYSLPEELVKSLSIHTGLKYDELIATPDRTEPDEERFPDFQPWKEAEKPLAIKKGQILGVTVNFYPELPMFVQSNMVLEGVDGQGNPFIERITVMHDSTPDKRQLAELLRKRGES